MRQDKIDTGGLDYALCRYGRSRILFRGPRRALDPRYIACIGGTETFGKYILSPFPALLEARIAQTCVNLGCVNGGIDVFVDDPVIMQICQEADRRIVQVMGANLLSNRYYTVHPRRNDRFLHASAQLQAIYPEVDFTEFAFTRHLLGRLCDVSPVRFEIVVHELRQAWVARMRQLLSRIGPKTVLLWFSTEPLSDTLWFDRPGRLQIDPLFITAAMVDRLRPLVGSIAVITPSPEALARGSFGMVVPPPEQAVAAQMLGLGCHEEAAAALARLLGPA